MDISQAAGELARKRWSKVPKPERKRIMKVLTDKSIKARKRKGVKNAGKTSA